MAVTTIIIGDTTIYTVTFRDPDGALTDPDSNAATFKAYDFETLAVVETGAATRLSQGVYRYLFTVPGTGYDDEKKYIFEMRALFSTEPQLERKVVKAKFKP